MAKKVALGEMAQDKDVTIGISYIEKKPSTLLPQEESFTPLTTDDIVTLEDAEL